jgi:hypothetical protein
VFTTAVRGEPFQYAVVVPVDPEINPVPEMKRVNVWLPAVMLAGANSVIIGVALGCPLVEPDPEPHPEIIITRDASIPNMVHRKCINRILH